MSAALKAAFIAPRDMCRLTIAADNGPAGRNAPAKLCARAITQGVEVRVAFTRLEDFNDDWMAVQKAWRENTGMRYEFIIP